LIRKKKKKKKKQERKEYRTLNYANILAKCSVGDSRSSFELNKFK